MKKLLLVPLVLFPYVLLFNVICVYTGFLMAEVFQNLIIVMVLYLFIYVLLVLVCNIAYIMICRTKKTAAKEMAKANMIVKLVQIPGYIAVFILGFICLISIFTIGFTFFFFLYDCISIFLTGMIGFFAIMQNKKKNEKLSAFYLISIITQFIFCIDVVSAVVLYSRIGIIKNDEKIANDKPEIEFAQVSKIGLITYLGSVMFGFMLALSEVLFPDLEDFLSINPWYDVFLYLSLALSLLGFVLAVIKKNKTNSSKKEYLVEIMITALSSVAMLIGIVFSGELLGRAVFSFGSGVFIVNVLGVIQTFIGVHKNGKSCLNNEKI